MFITHLTNVRQSYLSLKMNLPAFSTPCRIWCNNHFSTVISVCIIHIKFQWFCFMCFNKAEQIFRLQKHHRRKMILCYWTLEQWVFSMINIKITWKIKKKKKATAFGPFRRHENHFLRWILQTRFNLLSLFYAQGLRSGFTKPSRNFSKTLLGQILHILVFAH